MSTSALDSIKAWLKEHEQELIDDLRTMLRIPSLKEDSQPGAPFGQANRDALDLALSLGQSWGMTSKSVDHKIGYCEFGSGDRMVMTLGHLDVVPVGPGWKHEPFGAEIDGEYIYCRGAIDDKGPSMAAFYAARAIHACIPDLQARIRVVFGCDEESGMECVKRYVETEEIPTFGIAPDSSWPLVHGEKGITDLEVVATVPESSFQLIECEGGQRTNIVIDSMTAKLKVGDASKAHVREKIADQWDKNVVATWESDAVLRVETTGKAAHGSRPFSGDSAATRLFRFLYEIAPLESVQFYERLLWITHPSGVGVGIHGRDDVSRDLTSNLGVVRMNGSDIALTVNVRYPVTWKGEDLRARCESFFNDRLEGQFRLHRMSDSPPLYFPVDHPLAHAIIETYQAETGDSKRKPGVMGGGTYARMIPNTVSVGTGWEGDGHAHETDERVKIEHIHKMARIYAAILLKLATMPL